LAKALQVTRQRLGVLRCAQLWNAPNSGGDSRTPRRCRDSV